MNLYIIEKQKDLIGKVISAVDIVGSYDEKGRQIIVTECGGIYMQDVGINDANEDVEIVSRTTFKARTLHLIANDAKIMKRLTINCKLISADLEHLAQDEIAKAKERLKFDRAERMRIAYERSKAIIKEYEKEFGEVQ